MHCFPLLAVPGLRDQLRPKLEDEAEDAVDDVHDWSRFLGEETPAEVKAGWKVLGETRNLDSSEGTELHERA